MALYPQDVITREIIETELRSDVPDSPIDKMTARSGSLTIAQAVEENMRSYFAGFGENLPPPGLYDRVLTEMEYPLILAALTATRGNQIKAADLLGLNRNTLRKKIRELGVSVYRSSRGASAVAAFLPQSLDTPALSLHFRHKALLKRHADLRFGPSLPALPEEREFSLQMNDWRLRPDEISAPAAPRRPGF
jgi:DNA-binding protein Fis